MTLLIFCHIRPTGSAVTGDSTTVDSHTKQHVEGMGACPKGGGWLFPGGGMGGRPPEGCARPHQRELLPAPVEGM